MNFDRELNERRMLYVQFFLFLISRLLDGLEVE